MSRTYIMPTRDDWENETKLREYLAVQLKSGRLALLLGSGVSTVFGLPMWDDLINKLYATRGEIPPPKKKPEKQAQDFRLKFYRNDSVEFIRKIREILYENVCIDFDSLRKNGTLAAIGSLVMASHRGRASKVITFNWDDLLEHFLEYHGFVTSSVGSEIHWAEDVDVEFLHPHGLIPFDIDADATEPEKIIFDQRSFSTIVGNEALPWRQHILSIMRTHTCLFIGLSGDDQNLDSLLLKCQEEHAILKDEDKPAYWGVTFADTWDEGSADGWDDRNVYYKQVSSYSEGLPEFLLGICQAAVQLEKRS